MADTILNLHWPLNSIRNILRKSKKRRDNNTLLQINIKKDLRKLGNIDMNYTESLENSKPLSSLKKKYLELTGGLDVRSVDISKELPRHPTKRYKRRCLDKISRIVIHTTDRDWSILRLVEFDIGPNHISNTGCAAITYHDVIMDQGTVFHTLPYREVSFHAGGYNTSSVAVALMYRCTDPKTGKDTFAPTTEALKALTAHCGKLCLKFGLTPNRIFGHRELKGTGWFRSKSGSKRLRKTCPGLQVDLDKVRRAVTEYMQIYLRIQGFYQGKVDGDFGKNTRKAFKAFLNKE